MNCGTTRCAQRSPKRPKNHTCAAKFTVPPRSLLRSSEKIPRLTVAERSQMPDGVMSQISRAYSATARSLENIPIWATLRVARRLHSSRSR
jgi:hypothetical protein